MPTLAYVNAQALPAKAPHTAEPVTVLFPADRGHVGKSYHRKPDGSIGKGKFRNGKRWIAREFMVSSAWDRFELRCRMTAYNNAAQISGRSTKLGENQNRRYKGDIDPETGRVESPDVAPRANHSWTFDFDHVANIAGIDPRIEPMAAVRFLFALLPTLDELHDADRGVHWSSSCAVGTPAGQAPPELGFHFGVHFDRPFSGQEYKELCLALQLHCSSEVSLLGKGLVGSPPDGPCDNESGLDPPLS